MANVKRRLSDEEVAQAKRVAAYSWLLQHRGHDFKQVGRGEWQHRVYDSLTLYEGGWHRFSSNTGGKDAISYLCTIEGLDFISACREVLGLPEYEYREDRSAAAEQPRQVQAVPAPPTDQPAEARQLELPTADEKNHRVFAYLTKTRGLNRGVVNDALKQDLIYQSAKYGSAVFLGKDKAGQVRYASVRGTSEQSRFRQECAGSDKRYAFCYTPYGGHEVQRLVVAESPIDALSMASLEGPRKDSSYLSLGGVSTRGLCQFLSEHKQVQHLVLALDNDQAGRTGALRVVQEATKLNPELRFEAAIYEGKDPNTFLLAGGQLENEQQKTKAQPSMAHNEAAAPREAQPAAGARQGEVEKTFILPQASESQDPQFFTQRLAVEQGISAAVVRDCLQQGLLFKDTREQVVFTGRDQDGQIRFAHVLLQDQRAHDVRHSDPACGFVYQPSGAEQSQRLVVCNRPLDALAMATLEGPESRSSYLSLSFARSDAFEHFLNGHPEIREVCLVPNDDERAISLMGRCQYLCQQRKLDLSLYDHGSASPASYLASLNRETAPQFSPAHPNTGQSQELAAEHAAMEVSFDAI